ncbi:C40 family peptidase [Planococcus sp. YIM B11945]|uniref:C40 family peptidase n=1 Tax=Planococcus sp. YIM B11945 TaxID=3435410 RepID=UPI003D7C6E55
MKKLIFTVLAASSLIISSSATDAQAATNNSNSDAATSAITYEATTTDYTLDIEQVASSKAVKMSGKYKTKVNANIRQDAGTKYKIVKMAKKGTSVTATHKKKVGKQTWYKVKAGNKTGWILSTLVKKATVKKASNSTSNSKVVDVALGLKGIPYKFGGTTTAGFDCSGFTQYVFKKAGKSISRSTLTQYAETKKVTTPEAGDLIFFKNTYRAGISHVGIYIGNGQFVHAGGSESQVRSVNDSYWKKYFDSYRTF